MGVRGLTTFIAKNASKYLDPHELHDCNLVIDGDSLCSQLYKQIDHGKSAFGGNYDEFYRHVVEFFNLLKQCNVVPYVLLDGGYEMRKMKTTRERLRSRIGVIKYIVPLESYFVLPLMMREVFVNALKNCHVKLYRCLFEADNEIAILARKLNCPVLSYDSDFYIFDGQYIPFVTITPKIYKKTITSKSSYEVEIIPKKQKGQKNVRRKGKKVTIEVEDNDESCSQKTGAPTYNYLDCSIYTIQNLTDGVLENDMLPLFAIMLGNDFISRKWFSKFYRNVRKRKVNKKKNLSPQQKRIHTLLNWLQHESLISAIKKILECVKQYQRPRLWYQIRTAMNGYRLEKSKSFEYFGFKEEVIEQEDIHNICDLTVDEIMALECENESEQEEEEECEDDESENEASEAEEEKLENSDQEDGFETKKSEEEDFVEKVESEEEEVVAVEVYQRKNFEFPEWFLNLYHSGCTPRFPVDLIRNHRYINYPQVEDFSANDSNLIAYPILNMLYSLLHTPNIPSLFYYTRIVKQVRYEIKKLDGIFPEITDFDPNEKKSVRFIHRIFERSFANYDEIFKIIMTEIPEQYQLYILAVIYWIKRSSSTDSNFLKSVIISLIVMNIIDKKCEKMHRDAGMFQKKYEKHLRELKEKATIASEESLKDTSIKSIIKNMTKQEALLCMESLVNNFEISAKFIRKHADFNRRIVHTYAELQAVIYNLSTVNVVLNYPFENIKIENFFNGLFLYNIYSSLKSRNNSLEYIKFHLFKHSTALFVIFNKIFDICLKALPYLSKETINNNENLQRVPKKPKVKKPKNPKPIIANDCANESTENEEFIDMNNQFSQLLKNFE
ncbi:hypothetical protein PVAND_013855 [Polypedilum vanderplanki]|uniref:XPG N-terminal domain-containing protein n=1 Tax=Polypedilum vanderplanki TaxID=319348 RepID=A0A9J6CQM8_POLVA|nr:hypothetical protein PVAND_013855 [Polypedilum vanderplanki]